MTTLVTVPDPPGMTIFGDTRRPQGRSDDIVAAAQVVEQILDRVLPGWRTSIPSDKSKRWQQQRQAAQRSVAQLERRAEVAEKLGDSAPRLSASSMHPWVWDAARSLWQSGHFAEAVVAAAVKINAEAQNRLGRRDVSETALFNEAFSEGEAKPGKPKLRLHDPDGSDTYRSLQRGARAFAEGCYAALRNPKSHDPQDEIPEHIALEQLAAFSVLARWTSEADLDTA